MVQDRQADVEVVFAVSDADIEYPQLLQNDHSLWVVFAVLKWWFNIESSSVIDSLTCEVLQSPPVCQSVSQCKIVPLKLKELFWGVCLNYK